MTEIEWTETDWKNRPTIAGWYAVHFCWDSNEGSFCGSCHWDGAEWSENLPIFSRSSSPFETEEEAEKWAADNDVSN